MRFVLGAILLLSIPTGTWAQTAPSVRGHEPLVWAGGEVSDFNPDYSCSSNLPFDCGSDLHGIGLLGNLDVSQNWWGTAEMRWLPWNGADSESEWTFLLGPGYRFWSRNRLSLSAKAIVGVGHFRSSQLNETMFVYAPGFNADWRLRPRVSVFLDYEYQRWPSFAGVPTVNSSGQLIQHDHGLTPNGFSVGVLYRIF